MCAFVCDGQTVAEMGTHSLLGLVLSKSVFFSALQCMFMPCLRPTASYGIERLNNEVSSWMRADRTLDGGKAAPPFLAMGWVLSCAWHSQQLVWDLLVGGQPWANAFLLAW